VIPGTRFGDGNHGRVLAGYGERRETGTATWGPSVSHREREVRGLAREVIQNLWGYKPLYPYD